MVSQSTGLDTTRMRSWTTVETYLPGAVWTNIGNIFVHRNIIKPSRTPLITQKIA